MNFISLTFVGAIFEWMNAMSSANQTLKQLLPKTILMFLLLGNVSIAQNLDTNLQNNSSPSCDEKLDSSQWTNCVGSITDQNGDQYTGQFVGGQYSGHGRRVRKNGTIYEGEFANGKANGFGFVAISDGPLKGDTYTGSLKDDQFEGIGIYKKANGLVYVGEWSSSKPNGSGINKFIDGTKYVGEFKDGTFNGFGTVKTPDSNIYAGEFANNKIEGAGVFYFSNRTKHLGYFSNGKPNGSGVRTNADGSFDQIGEWKDGNLIKPFSETIAKNTNTPAAGQEPKSASNASNLKSRWSVNSETSKLNGSTIVTMSNDAIDRIRGTIGFDSRAAIIIRCREKKTELFFSLGTPVETTKGSLYEALFSFRIDTEKPLTLRGNLSTDRQAIFVEDGIEFAKMLFNHNEFVLQFTPAMYGPQETVFQIHNLQNDITPLRKECGW